MPNTLGLGLDLPEDALLDWEKTADQKRQKMLQFRDRIKSQPYMNKIGYDTYSNQAQEVVNQSQARLAATTAGAEGKAARAAADRQMFAQVAQRKAQEKLAKEYADYVKKHPYQNQGSLTTQPGQNPGGTGTTTNNAWVAAGRSVPGLAADQFINAQAIASAALSRGLGREGVIMGIMTALTESTLQNVNHGDQMGPSSRGLFQQMPSWGSEQDRMNPARAANLFFQALMQQGNWQSMTPWQAAQAVQQSQFADGSNYQKNYQRAVEITDQLIKPGNATAVTWQNNPSQTVNASSQIRRTIVTQTLSALGTPYDWGGESLKYGVDCSGLVQQVYKSVGITLPHSANLQSDAYGTDTNIYGRRVPLAQLQPGDLVAWDHNRSNERSDFVGHIAVYIGNGQIVEAYTSGMPVRQRALRPNEEHIYGVHMTLPGDR